MSLFPLAASNMDAVIGVIAVVVWILSQVLSRKKGDAPPGAPDEPSAPLDPQAELRRFFEQMERSTTPGEPPPEERPAPPPQRIPVHHKRPPPLRVRRTESQPPPLVEPTPVQVVPPAPVFDDLTLLPANQPARLAGTAAITAASAYSPAMQDLRDPTALRRMIVAMEVLGKPVALRQGP